MNLKKQIIIILYKWKVAVCFIIVTSILGGVGVTLQSFDFTYLKNMDEKNVELDYSLIMRAKKYEELWNNQSYYNENALLLMLDANKVEIGEIQYIIKNIYDTANLVKILEGEKYKKEVTEIINNNKTISIGKRENFDNVYNIEYLVDEYYFTIKFRVPNESCCKELMDYTKNEIENTKEYKENLYYINYEENGTMLDLDLIQYQRNMLNTEIELKNNFELSYNQLSQDEKMYFNNKVISSRDEKNIGIFEIFLGILLGGSIGFIVFLIYESNLDKSYKKLYFSDELSEKFHIPLIGEIINSVSHSYLDKLRLKIMKDEINKLDSDKIIMNIKKMILLQNKQKNIQFLLFLTNGYEKEIQKKIIIETIDFCKDLKIDVLIYDKISDIELDSLYKIDKAIIIEKILDSNISDISKEVKLLEEWSINLLGVVIINKGVC